jgi:valyl-tRNA synthetase
MATLNIPEIPKDYDAASIEERCRALWEETGIYKYDPAAPGEVFSVDTPPPYVSAAHLHVGHAMSYTQAEIVIRYQRMKGRKIYYPMGFDDNGLPTERFVEKTYNINKQKTTRAEFRALCLEETRKGAAQYEELWRALGMSVDWTLRYSTIDDHCRRTAQKSFLDLYKKGRVYRSNEPVLWDTHFETALAQADLESMARKGKMHDIAFSAKADGTPLVISTTRPELIPACVALYHHPDDERYKHLAGTTAVVPLFGHEVPILTDESVDPAFGTGLMMVCTFGDGEDVRKWKRDNLALRLVVGADGKMLPSAGEFAGQTVEIARNNIVGALARAGHHLKTVSVEQNVSVAERSGVPVEFNMAPQWFIRVLDIKPEMLARSAQLRWNPEWMKVRLDHWIEGLKYDWNISRQRFYGVPFPVWYCQDCGEAILADEASLPVDPLEDACPLSACPKCGSGHIKGEPDVMDTWMTSSLTPLINANWAETAGRKGDMSLHPMTVRVQAFEIIRTWLFYTLIKSDAHLDTLPWRDVMISGWGLNENGKKISKRDLEQYTDKDGYNRYEPFSVVKKFGADALRFWAAGSHLGHDMRFNEKDVKDGRKLAVKLWNAARFVLMQIEGFDPDAPRPAFADRMPEDRWLLTELNKILPGVEAGFEGYNYAVARESIERFFWATFCDDYLEMVKHRFWKPELYSEEARVSARATLWEALRVILSLYAPFVPFTTEDLYQRIYRPVEGAPSLHITAWPTFDADRTADVPEMQVVMAILRAVRQLRTEARLSQTRALEAVVIDVRTANDELKAVVDAMRPSIQAVARAAEVRIAEAAYPADVAGLAVGIVAGEAPEKPKA